MQQIQKILFVALLLCLQAQLMAQYITLKGKQFYAQDGATPFYPVVCHYIVELAYDPINYPLNNPLHVDDFELQPYSSYGAENTDGDYADGFDDSNHDLMAKGEARIKADFQKMVDMGFNTVCILGLDIKKMECTNSYNTGGFFPARTWPGPSLYFYSCDFHLTLSDYNIFCKAPYATDYNFQNIVLPKIKRLLVIADEVGINLMMRTGYGFTSHENAQADDYADYLAALADKLKGYTRFFAYDIDQEAGLFWAANDPDVCHDNNKWIVYKADTKTRVCETTAQFYDAIKTADPNHLVTMGDCDIARDIMHYDQTILKLDFNSLHLYPDQNLFENYNNVAATNRIIMELYWLNRNSPIPWIIGETGVPANIDRGANHLTCDEGGAYYNADISVAPWVWGDHTDQTEFALQTQQAVLNYGGSGYSWWQFQNTWWPHCGNGAGTYTHRNYGLLDFGVPDYNGGVFSYAGDDLEKPFVNLAFTDNTIKTANAPATEPDGYYNPFGGNHATNYTVDGTITDGNGPAKGGVIKAANNIDKADPRYDLNFEIFTFTHDDGNFELISPIGHIYDQATHTIDYSKFTNEVSYSAPAASHAQSAWSSVTLVQDNDTLSLYHGTFPALSRQLNVFDNNGAAIPNPIDNSNSPKTNTSRHILTVEDVVVEDDGVADFHASTEVDLKPGFESQLGSQTDVYIATVDFDCNTLTDGTNAFKTDGKKMLHVTEHPNKSIEVTYRLQNNSIKLIPNPTTDVVNIVTEQTGIAQVEITTYSGAIVFANKLTLQNTTPLSLTNLASGCYFVKVATNIQTEIFKLIITKN
ncbi:MAG: T9SS type A sorting domain-containing protein [Bacteroidetes bacterium]|nr:T9SS type A sorting domain-containing protein [Bacteroidota bacterium]